jgi:hypothetical protein
MECITEKNKTRCTCTYEPCPRKYTCCECLHYHRKNDELPACFFTRESERTYDRSVAHFLKMKSGKA